MKATLIVVGIVAFILVFLLVRRLGDHQQLSHFGDNDQNYALAALEDLDRKMLDNRYTNGIPEVDDYYLTQNSHNIHLIKQPHGARVIRGSEPGGTLTGIEGSYPLSDDGSEPSAVDGKEHLSFMGNPPVNTSYWPYYFYTAPYQHADTGAWPPNMQSRLYNWQPGFASGSGWSYWLRPGISYTKWPRNRWVRQNDNYYFINNGDTEQDRIRDYTGEPS